MEITKELVEYVATLSRLKLSDEECESTQKSLGEIISYMDILNNVNTDGIEPMTHAFGLKNVMRDDVVKPSSDRADLLSNAPKADDEAIIVPKTIE